MNYLRLNQLDKMKDNNLTINLLKNLVNKSPEIRKNILDYNIFDNII